MSINLTALMKQRYDTAANWTAQNPTLLAGEIGIESDTKKWKVGTGATAWTSLTYAIGGTYPIVNADIAAGAAIAYSKLATLTSGNIVLGSAANVATSTAVTGDVTISNTGVTAIAAGVIVNADINASAAIADTKLATIATAGKVSNSATTATSALGANTIVARDASNNFTAGIITAALTGAASSNVLKAGDTMTGPLVTLAGTVTANGIQVGTGTTDKPGIYSPGADQLAISTSGTGRITVDASGNVNIDSNTLYVNAVNDRVGIGTSGPTSKLDVRGSATDFDGLRVLNTESSGQTSSAIRLGITNSIGIRNCRIQATELNTDSNNVNLDFYTNDANAVDSETIKMRLTGGGSLGIGTTNPAYQLEVSTDSAGKPSSALWTIVSDERIKEDIELADLDLCYEAIKAIPLKRYKWRDDIYTAEQVTDRRKLGWIAQDVEAIFPKAVGTHEFKYNQVFEETIIPAVEEELDADGNVITPAQPERIEQGDLISEDVIEDCRDLNFDQIYAAMYGAVQKLIAKVETLEVRLTAAGIE